MPFQLKTYLELYDAQMAAILAAFPGALIADRSLVRTIIHAAATQDAEQYVQMARILDVFSIDTAKGEDLDRRALDYGISRLQPIAAIGSCRVRNSTVTAKIEGSLSAGVLAGASAITLQAGEGALFPSTFSYNVILERDGPGTRELVVVISKVGDTLNLQNPLQNNHLINSSVILSTSGSDVIIAATTEIFKAETATTAEVSFETDTVETLYDGDVETADIPITALQVGSGGIIGSGSLQFRSKPFTDAEVYLPTSTGGGRDLETDEDLRQRIKDVVQSLSRGTPLTLETVAVGIESGGKTVTTAQVVEPVGMGASNIWIDDGTGTLTFEEQLKTDYEAVIYNAEVGEARGRLINWPILRTTIKFFKDLDRGTATAVAASSLTDSTKSWTPGAYTGYVVIDDNAQMWTIGNNTATELTPLTPLAGAPATPSLGNYSIFNPASSLVIYDVANYPSTPPTASQDILVNYSTGEVELNELKYPSGLDEKGSLIATDYDYATGLVLEVAKTLLGDPNNLDVYPGYKAAGTYLEIKIPIVVNYAFNIQIVAEQGYLESELSDLVKEKVIQYVNASGIGDNIILSEIIKRVKSIVGIYDVRVLSPTDNLVILDGYLPKTDTGLITVV